MQYLPLIVILVAGCNNLPLRFGDSSLPAVGIYECNYELVSNDCSVVPTPLTHDFAVFINRSTGAPAEANVPLPTNNLLLRGTVGPVPDAERLTDCGASVSVTREMLSIDASGLTIKRTTVWSDLPAKFAACDLPQSNCSSVETFDYQLIAACLPPCNVESHSFDGDTCRCP